MNNSDGKEWYGIGLDTKQFEEGANRVKNGFANIENQASQSSKGIAGYAETAAKATVALLTIDAAAGFVKKLAEVRGQFQQLEIAFTTMLGSEKKATELMAQLTKTAASTPFDLEGVATGAKQLLAYGFQVDKVNETLITLGNVASGVSAPLGDIVYLYGTLRASGRVALMDIRQFAGRGIPIYEELAKVMHTNVESINELASAGKIGFADIEKAFKNMSSEGGRFDNLMAKQADSIKGLQSNLGDAIMSAQNDLGKKLQPVFESLLKGGIDIAENYKEIGKIIFELIAVYGAYRTALIVIIALQKLNSTIMRQAVIEKKLAAMASIQLSNAQAIAAARTKTFALAQEGLVKSLKAVAASMAANPYILLAAAIAGVAFAIYKVASAKTEMDKANSRMNDEFAKSEAGALLEQKELAKLKGELAATQKGTEEYAKIKDEIIKKFGKYNSGLQSEIDKVGLLDSTYQSLGLSIKQAYDQKHYEKFVEDQSAATDEIMSKNLNKIFDKVTSQFGDEVGAKYYAEIKNALISGEKLNAETQDLIYGVTDRGYYKNPGLNKYYENIKQAIKATEEADKIAKVKFGGKDALEIVEGSVIKKTATIQDRIKKTNEDLIAAQKKLSEMRKASSTATDKDIEAQQESVDKLQKQLELLKGVKDKKAKSDDASGQDVIDKTSKKFKELQDQIALSKLEGKDRELLALKQQYDAELEAFKASEEVKNALAEKYALDRLEIEKKYQNQYDDALPSTLQEANLSIIKKAFGEKITKENEAINSLKKNQGWIDENNKAVEERHKQQLEEEYILRGQILESATQLANVLTDIVGISDEEGNVLNNLMQGFKQGGPWGYVSAFFSEFINGIGSIFEKEDIYAKKLSYINKLLEKNQKLIEQSGRSGGEKEAYEERIKILQQEIQTITDNFNAEMARMKKKSEKWINAGPKPPSLEVQQQMLEDLTAEQKKQLDEITQEYQDLLSGGITQNDIADIIAQGFEDGKTSVDDFASYMNDVLTQAVIEVFKKDILGESINALQADIRQKLSDGILTADEKKSIDEQVKAIADANKQIWDNLTGALDLGNTTTDQQAASTKGFAVMSQDTGDELNGRFTSLQMSGIETARNTGVMVLDVGEIRKTSFSTAENMLALRDISLSGLNYLIKIEKNTNELYAMNEKLDKIEKNTKQL